MAQRGVGRLSSRQAINAKPKHGADAALLADGGNLYLQLTRGDGGHIRRSWLFRYELNGRRREAGLGPLHTRGLAEARAEAKRLRQLLLDGIDPLEHRRKGIEARAVQASKDKTFGQVAGEYLKAHQDDWQNRKHARQWQASLMVEARALRDLPVAAIDTAHILSVLQPIWPVKPETASRTRARIERVLAFAVAAQYRRREDGNPARWDGHLQELLGAKGKAKKAKHERTGQAAHRPALPYKEAAGFMATLRGVNSLPARALEFTVLTAARRGEVIGACWSEFNLQENIWNVPAGRTKTSKAHRVPLCDQAVAILRALPRDGGDRVFPLGDKAMQRLLHGLRPGVVPHGFRSTFMDWAHEQTAFPKTVIDMALAHAIGDRVEASYRRGDLFERRTQLMKAWADYCDQPAAVGATVTPLRPVTADA
jgi:integrase